MRDEEIEGMQQLIDVYTGWIATFTPTRDEAARRTHDRSRKLYVGDLDASVTNEDLKIFFRLAGACESASVKVDRLTGRSRGFAYVEMASAEDARNAIQKLDGKDLKGRPVAVRAPQERQNGKGGRGGWYRR